MCLKYKLFSILSRLFLRFQATTENNLKREAQTLLKIILCIVKRSHDYLAET